MKKILLALAVCLCAWNASAQDNWLDEGMTRENWAIGGRIGAGLQFVAQYRGLGDVAGKPFYLEGRFGMSWCNAGAAVVADFTALAAWNCVEFGQTDAGKFFADFGGGISVGGKSHYAYVGVAGLARCGFKFSGAPVSLSADWTPLFGPHIAYGGGGNYSEFHRYGLANFGVTCTYNF